MTSLRFDDAPGGALPWKRQLTAFYLWATRVNVEFSGFDRAH